MKQTMDIYPNIDIIIISSLTFLITYFLYNHALYWWFKQVPGPIPLPLLGNQLPLLLKRISTSEYYNLFYGDYGGKRYCGYYEFSQKTIMIADLDILKNVLVRDLDNFDKRRETEFEGSIMEQMLFPDDEKWREDRPLVSSSSNLKESVPRIEELGRHFVEQLFQNDKRMGKEIEMTKIFHEYSMKTIAAIVFGEDIFNELVGQEDEFITNTKKFLDALPKRNSLGYLFMELFPFMAKITGFKHFDESALFFFKKVVEKALRDREEKHIGENDILEMLKDVQEEEKKRNPSKKYSDVFIAKCIAFFASCGDIVSTTLSLFLHSVAFNAEIQEKVLEEIHSVLKGSNGKITYDALNEMTYLDMTLQETERIYPAVPRIYRVCKNKYHIPETNLTLDPGTVIVVPINSILNDPEHYRDPQIFEPERFSPQNKAKIHPVAYLASGLGPTNCSGMNMAKLVLKISIVLLVLHYRVSPCKLSSKSVDMEDTDSGVTKPLGGIWLNVEKR